MGTTGTAIARIVVTATLRGSAVLAGVATTAGAAWGAQDVVLSTVRPEGGDLITVEGSISGVHPGAPSAPLRLTLRNAGTSPRVVTRVAAGQTGVQEGPASCAGDHLAVRDWTGSVTVPAGGSAHVTLPVAVSAGLPAECGRVVWGLAYTAY